MARAFHHGQKRQLRFVQIMNAVEAGFSASIIGPLLRGLHTMNINAMWFGLDDMREVDGRDPLFGYQVKEILAQAEAIVGSDGNRRAA